MRNNLVFLLLAADIIALAIATLLFPATPRWLLAAMLFLAALLLGYAYISIVRPIKTLTLGMDLVNSQDFSSRLAKVGHPDADKLVGMFNRMMDSLRNERLRRHEQNSFLELLIESSPMGIVVFDFDNRMDMINPAASRLLSHGQAGKCPENWRQRWPL